MLKAAIYSYFVLKLKTIHNNYSYSLLSINSLLSKRQPIFCVFSSFLNRHDFWHRKFFFFNQEMFKNIVKILLRNSVCFDLFFLLLSIPSTSLPPPLHICKTQSIANLSEDKEWFLRNERKRGIKRSKTLYEISMLPEGTSR